MAHSHYFKDVSNLKVVDVYRVLELFDVVNPSIQHAVKKLLVAGGRGSKSVDKDIQEAIDSLERWKQMRVEDTYVGSTVEQTIGAPPFPYEAEHPRDSSPFITSPAALREYKAGRFNIVGTRTGRIKASEPSEVKPEPWPEMQYLIDWARNWGIDIDNQEAMYELANKWSNDIAIAKGDSNV